MRSYGLVFDLLKDLTKTIKNLTDRSVIYADKFTKFEKRILYRRENTKFDLYLGRFYKGLSDKADNTYQISTEEIKNTGSMMWELESYKVESEQ